MKNNIKTSKKFINDIKPFIENNKRLPGHLDDYNSYVWCRDHKNYPPFIELCEKYGIDLNKEAPDMVDIRFETVIKPLLEKTGKFPSSSSQEYDWCRYHKHHKGLVELCAKLGIKMTQTSEDKIHSIINFIITNKRLPRIDDKSEASLYRFFMKNRINVLVFNEIWRTVVLDGDKNKIENLFQKLEEQYDKN